MVIVESLTDEYLLKMVTERCEYILHYAEDKEIKDFERMKISFSDLKFFVNGLWSTLPIIDRDLMMQLDNIVVSYLDKAQKMCEYNGS